MANNDIFNDQLEWDNFEELQAALSLEKHEIISSNAWPIGFYRH